MLHQYRVVYVPIPKVACSSFLKYFAGLLGIEEGPKDDINQMYFPSVPQGRLCDLQDYFKFAFVRNPWDRLVSCYSNKISPTQELSNKRFTKGVAHSLLRNSRFYGGMEFREFVRVVVEWPDDVADFHIRSQSAFLTDEKGGLIVDHLGHFENLAGDFLQLCQQHGLPIEGLPHLRQSAHSNYAEYYDHELSELVRKRYERDIDIFKYKFR